MSVKVIAKADFVAQVIERGGKMLVGEWRGCKAELVKYVDDKGKGREFVKLDHVIEYGNPSGGLETCKLSERQPPEIKTVADVQTGLYSKGQIIVARINTAVTAKGANVCGCNSGEIYVLVD